MRVCVYALHTTVPPGLPTHIYTYTHNPLIGRHDVRRTGW